MIGLLILWFIAALILIGFNYKVTSYDPNDDLLELLSNSIDEDKIDLVWEQSMKEDKKTTVITRRIIFLPSNSSLYKQIKEKHEEYK
mgnify:CR=1 FL=1